MIEYRVTSISPASTPATFTISSSTGIISTAVELDRETVTEYVIELEVTG